MKHNLPLGTRVAFKPGPGWGTTIPATVCVVDNYQTLLYCKQPCEHDHDEDDCYKEPHMLVRVQHWISVPISRVSTIWEGESHYGRSPQESDWDLEQ